MDPVTNPYTPGAGAPPPKLAGRDDLLRLVSIATQRVRAGRQAKSVLMIGLRGVGKTVLLDRMRDDAEVAGLRTLRIEAPEGRSLPAILAPQLRQVLLRLSRSEKARDLGRRALSALAGFAKALKVKYQDIEVGIDFDPEPGLADNGDLERGRSSRRSSRTCPPTSSARTCMPALAWSCSTARRAMAFSRVATMAGPATRSFASKRSNAAC